jgi:hypothetical protein
VKWLKGVGPEFKPQYLKKKKKGREGNYKRGHGGSRSKLEAERESFIQVLLKLKMFQSELQYQVIYSLGVPSFS